MERSEHTHSLVGAVPNAEVRFLVSSGSGLLL